MLTTLRDHKRTIPQLPSRYVTRPRLLAQLDRAASLPLTLLCAGPGAGKTALLADWAQRASAQVAWLSPAAADAETGRFWRLLQSALPDGNGTADGNGTHGGNGTHHGSGTAVPSLTAATPVPGQELAHLLSSHASAHHVPLVVIIDDAHVLSYPGVLDALDSLIRGQQPRVRLILAARSDPPLPFHKYRLAGQMLELRAADLAMTPAETREVLARHGVLLTEGDLAAIVARTEGWAAGVRLSATRMAGGQRPGGLASQFPMDLGGTGEYLMDEVLRQLPDQQRRMLIETSFLAEVTGPLADAVTGLAGSGDMLADLARRNCFVVPLDPMQTRYRYHPTFREVLSYLLQRPEGQSMRRLRQRAADWFEANADLGPAVYWAVQAGNGPHAARLLAKGGLAHAFVHRTDLSTLDLRSVLPLTAPGDAATVDAISGSGTTVTPESAEAAVAGAVIAALCASEDAAAAELGRLRAVRPALALAGPSLAAATDLAELILGQKACDADAVDAAARRLLAGDAGDAIDAGPSPAPGLRAAVLLAQASTHMWHGRHEDVGMLLDAALAGAHRDGLPSLELEVLATMVLTDSIWARMSRADQVSRQARDLQRRTGLATPPALELATALRAYLAGDFAGQAQALQRAVLPDAAGADPGLAAALMLSRASVLLVQGEEAGARAILRQQASRPIPPLLAVRRDVMIADLDTSLGRPRLAMALLDSYQGTKFAVLTAMARARAQLALGDPRQARDCVRFVLTTPSAQVRRLDFVSALLCDAQIAMASGERGRALEVLTQAIEMARDDIILPFRRAGDAFAGLLARHPDVAERWPAPISHHLEAGTATHTAPATHASGPPRDLADPLTARELTILRLLSTNMSTVEIATQLCLSVNTVKTHLGAIYRKLPASRRREAVLRARELELI